ncbi:MAG: hypothetical protein RLZ59_48, partial [Pseudomonadota bacterium]
MQQFQDRGAGEAPERDGTRSLPRLHQPLGLG